MKTLIFTLCLLFSVSAIGQNQIRNLTQWNLSGFVNDCLKELKIESTIICIQEYDGLILGKYLAVSFTHDTSFAIGISNTMKFSEIQKKISHELIHIKQLKNNELIVLDTNTIIFNDVKYSVSSNSHYADKHEIEARIKGEQLFKKYEVRYYIMPPYLSNN